VRFERGLDRRGNWAGAMVLTEPLLDGRPLSRPLGGREKSSEFPRRSPCIDTSPRDLGRDPPQIDISPVRVPEDALPLDFREGWGIEHGADRWRARLPSRTGAIRTRRRGSFHGQSHGIPVFSTVGDRTFEKEGGRNEPGWIPPSCDPRKIRRPHPTLDERIRRSRTRLSTPPIFVPFGSPRDVPPSSPRFASFLPSSASTRFVSID